MNTVRWMIVVMGLLLMTAVVMGQEENPPMPPHAVIVNNNPGVALRPITSANHEIRPYAVSMPMVGEMLQCLRMETCVGTDRKS